jgi:hypothetical protein
VLCGKSLAVLLARTFAHHYRSVELSGNSFYSGSMASIVLSLLHGFVGLSLLATSLNGARIAPATKVPTPNEKHMVEAQAVQ